MDVIVYWADTFEVGEHLYEVTGFEDAKKKVLDKVDLCLNLVDDPVDTTLFPSKPVIDIEPLEE